MKLMRMVLTAALCLTGAAARAEMSLADLVGSWTGSGTYHEALSQAKMKCRLTTVGDAAKVTISGRCGSSLGANDVVLDIVRQADGTVTMQSGGRAPGFETDIDQLTGRITGNQLMLSGEAGIERARLQFALNDDGSLRFASERKWQTGNSRSLVTLKQR